MGCHTSATSTGNNDNIQSQIDKLKAENISLMQKDYTGRKNWDKQLQASVKKASENNKRIEKLENQLKKGQTAKTEPKKTETKAAPIWKRAGEGWYIGEKGHEIRENYDIGGFDIVKVSGSNEKTIKHFKKLSDAKKYKV